MNRVAMIEAKEKGGRERGIAVLFTHTISFLPTHLYPRVSRHNTARATMWTVKIPAVVMSAWYRVQQIRRNPSDSPGRRTAILRARNWTRSRKNGTWRDLTGIASTSGTMTLGSAKTSEWKTRNLCFSLFQVGLWQNCIKEQLFSDVRWCEKNGC